jgi:hypothetical protein
MEQDYKAPQIRDYGRLTDITAGQANGEFTDRDFPVHTPRQDLTFSS